VKGDENAPKIQKNLTDEVDLEKYLSNIKFDPRQEIDKEKHIENFFQ